MPVVIGLTGSAGAGKTTVAKKLADLGCEVVDADTIAREVLFQHADELEIDHPAWFEEGRISPRRVAEDTFGNPETYRQLVKFLWPKTRSRAREIISASKSHYFVYDASMLFEAQAQNQCDLTLLVTADDAQRKERAMARSGWTETQFDQRQSFQWDQEHKAELATLRLHNSGSIADLELKVERLLRSLVPGCLQKHADTLQTEWFSANRWWLGDSIHHLDALDQVVAAMDRPGYHSIRHIERMLAKLRDTTPQAPPRLLGWIFAHDLVYQPGAPDNEARSADAIDRMLETTFAYRRLSADDRRAIESTKTHEPIAPGQLEDQALLEDIHLLHDLDLEILSANPEEYERYRQGVYAEYLAAAEDPSDFPSAWRKARREFLQGMLARGQIFKTDHFKGLESRARHNMASELEQISA